MESVFLGCFLFGLLLVIASALLGFAHLALPGGDGALHIGHAGSGVHTGHGHGADTGGHAGGERLLPLWNVSSLLAFLMWFGAAGYVAMRFIELPVWLALVPAIVFGVAGGLLVSIFLGFVLRGETVMNPADYRIEGTIARVTVGIPAGGTGEIVFTKGEHRRVEGARSLDGAPVARGEEVVVVEYQRGLAHVQGLQAFLASSGVPPLSPLTEELGRRPS